MISDLDIKNPLTNAKVVGSGITYEVYGRQDSKRGEKEFVMSRGALCEFAHCPNRWIMGFEDEETKSTEWGTLIDALVTSPEAFLNEFAVTPETYQDAKTGEEKDWNWNAKVCKEWRDGIGKKKAIKGQTYTQACNAVKFLLGDSRIRELIDCSKRQVLWMAEYHDKETDLVIPVKGLIDLLPDKENKTYGRSLADLKTCANAHPGAWPKAVYDHGYHVQAALYLDGYVAATGEDRNTFYHVLQESCPPWQVGRRIVSEEFVAIGRQYYIEALKKYAQCLATGVWNGYDDEGRNVIDGWNITHPAPWMVGQ